MPISRIDRTLAIGVLVIAVFGTLSAISMPVPSRRIGAVATGLLAIALVAHAGAYWFGDRIRTRFGLAVYIAVQAALLVLVRPTGDVFPIALALYMAFTAYAIVIARDRWGALPITLGAIVVFTASAVASTGMYRGSTVGLLLSLTGIVAFAISALVPKRPPALASPARSPNGVEQPRESMNGAASNLTPREREVLQALVSGARTSDIARDLGIADRTVKAHLANIYLKLGVETRAAAVALAVQQRLV